jgi:hypothetical protein
MEPPGIGVTALFSTNVFSSATLKSIPSLIKQDNAQTPVAVCRYPCEKHCRILLPMLGLSAGLPRPTEYDKDLVEADVSPW